MAAEYDRQQQQMTCMSYARQHVKRELWSYFALAGLFFVYLGALIIVYAVKGVFSAHAAMTFCGVFLAGAGAVNLIASCVFYRHHRHHHQSLSCLSDKDEEAKASSKSPAPRERSRLQGPNLPVFLTPEFAKYAEFATSDRRDEAKKYRMLQLYEPTRITISFAHGYWTDQQKPLISPTSRNPSLVHPLPPSIPRALLPFTSSRREPEPARVGSSGASNDISVVWSPGKVVQSSGTAVKQEHKDNSQPLGSPGKIIQGTFGAQNISEKNNDTGARKFEQVISETSVRVSGQANSGSHYRQTNDLPKASTSGDKVKDSMATNSGHVNIGAGSYKQQSGTGVRSSEQANKRASIRSTEQTSNRVSTHSSEQARKRTSIRSSGQASNKASIRSTETRESRSSRRTSQNQLQRQTSKNSDRT